MTLVDPHLRWLYDDTRVEARATTWVWVLFRWPGDVAPLIQLGMKIGSVSGSIVSAQMPLSLLPAASDLGIEMIELAKPMRPMLDKSRAVIGADKIAPLLGADAGTDVIIGIVDSGIDYTHSSLRRPDGSTRLKYIWDQRLTLLPDRSGRPRYPGERLPAGTGTAFQRGVEFTEAAINAALQPGARRLRTKDAPRGHGTHVAGIAAGNGKGTPNGKYVGIAPAADLIMVARSAGFSGVRDGIEYIMMRAKQMNRPCVVNLSLGTSLGARDGNSLTELALDAALSENGRAIVVAAGNSAAKKQHAQGKLTSGASKTLKFVVDQNAADNIVVEIWYGLAATPERFDVVVRAPDNSSLSLEAPASASLSRRGALQGSVASLDSAIGLPGHNKNRILLVVAKSGRTGKIAAGSWSVQLTARAIGSGSAAGTFHAYLDAEVARGKKVEFATGQYSEASTICVPASAKKAISVGSFMTSQLTLSTFSSQGPTLDGNRAAPLLCAPGQPITSTKAVNAQSTVTETFYVKQGTSMAAPHVAGVVAAIFQAKPGLSPADTATHLAETADKPQPEAPNTWGNGRVNALRAVEKAKLIS